MYFARSTPHPYLLPSLLQYDKMLGEKPQVVVVNKIDIPEAREASSELISVSPASSTRTV